jgi:hypothetical protein
MTDTFLVIIRDGMWHGGYEPHDMPYAFVSTRYNLEPIGGDPIPSDGHYRGIIVSDGILRLVSGGEFAYGMMMNQELRDYKVTFDDAYHDTHYAGVKRGYKGKRALAFRHCAGKDPLWMEGYRAGRRAKEEAKKVAA